MYIDHLKTKVFIKDTVPITILSFKNNYLLWDKCIENISCNEYIIYLNKEYYVENIDTMMIESNKYKLIQIRYK